jgi:short-subunit dehydrogenase
VLTVCPGYIATNFLKNMEKGRHAQRVGGSVRREVGADVAARATLRGILKRKRQIAVPWYYWIVIKTYENFPALIELVIRRSLRSTQKVLADKEKSAIGNQENPTADFADKR